MTESIKEIKKNNSFFFSYSKFDTGFVNQVAGYLKSSVDSVFCFDQQERVGDFIKNFTDALHQSFFFVFFVGQKTESSQYQKDELEKVRKIHGENFKDHIIPVILPNKDFRDQVSIPKDILIDRMDSIVFPESMDPLQTAIKICSMCQIKYIGIPLEDPNYFNYEKEIIRYFEILKKIENQIEIEIEELDWVRDKLKKGCLGSWPKVEKMNCTVISPNLLINSKKLGEPRPEDAFILVSARVSNSKSQDFSLGFPEAGPRKDLCFKSRPPKIKIAILVIGGIAPGINAVIDGIVQRHYLYIEPTTQVEWTDFNPDLRLEIHGLINGVDAFDDLNNSHGILVCKSTQYINNQLRIETNKHAHEGGSIIGTCRDNSYINNPERLQSIARQLKDNKYDILYVIGGDGGMKLAHAIYTHAKKIQIRPLRNLSVVAIPKTMDNDILWVWQSFGFMSAVEKAREVIEHIHTEITSNPRLGIIQLFGSVSGFVVSHAVLAGSTPNCYLALVPEVSFRLKKVAEYLKSKLLRQGNIPYGLIVMAETALPEDAEDIIEEMKNDLHEKAKNQGIPLTEIDEVLSFKESKAVKDFIQLKKSNKIIIGQTSDELRSACLKIVSKGLEYLLKKDESKDSPWEKLRMLTNEPRHIVRSIPPSSQDIITGKRLGSLAVDNSLAGYSDFMISQWLTEFVLVPLPLVVLGRKQIHKEGIFWKSVLAKTNSWDCFEA